VFLLREGGFLKSKYVTFRSFEYELVAFLSRLIVELSQFLSQYESFTVNPVSNPGRTMVKFSHVLVKCYCPPQSHVVDGSQVCTVLIV
jgi:hypothetical protein